MPRGWVRTKGQTARRHGQAEPVGASYRPEQLRHSEDRHHPLQIVGEDVQRHLGRDVFQGLHLEVRGAHPRLDRPEWVLDGLAP